MFNTYTQIYIHCILAVKYRDAVIHPSWKKGLHQYITGIVRNNGHKMLIINSMPDHVHLLIEMRPRQPLSDLMEKVKEDASNWINSKEFTRGRFFWQQDFGAFSYSGSEIHQITTYIENQELLHRRITFMEEYKKLLEESEVDFQEADLFKPLEGKEP